MKKVTVTGGEGFIGGHVVDQCIERGYEVTSIDNRETGGYKSTSKNVTYYPFDIRDTPKIAEVMKGADVVFHLAGNPRVQDAIIDPLGTASNNEQGTLSVLEAARMARVRRVIFSTTCAIYGDNEKLPSSEDFDPSPLTPYAIQKLAGEMYMKLYSRIYGIESISLRYFNAYGPRMDMLGPEAGGLGVFLRQRLQGNPLTITGDGTQTRDFVHVRDIARANLLAAESANVGKGEVINIGTGSRITMNNLAKLIGGPVEYIPPRLELKHSEAMITRAEKLLDWKPEIPIEEGIEELKKILDLN